MWDKEHVLNPLKRVLISSRFPFEIKANLNLEKYNTRSFSRTFFHKVSFTLVCFATKIYGRLRREPIKTKLSKRIYTLYMYMYNVHRMGGKLENTFTEWFTQYNILLPLLVKQIVSVPCNRFNVIFLVMKTIYYTMYI